MRAPREYLDGTRNIIVGAVMLMILILTIALTIGLVFSIYDLIVDETPNHFEKEDIFNAFSHLLLVIMGLELLDTVYGLLTEAHLQVETVLLVVVTAVARELIVFDYEKAEGVMLASVGIVVAAVAMAYYLIRRARALTSDH